MTSLLPLTPPPRWSDRAAPVPDGKQEGGQHVLHDLVHQLVLNWSQRSSSVGPSQTRGMTCSDAAFRSRPKTHRWTEPRPAAERDGNPELLMVEDHFGSLFILFRLVSVMKIVFLWILFLWSTFISVQSQRFNTADSRLD